MWMVLNLVRIHSVCLKGEINEQCILHCALVFQPHTGGHVTSTTIDQMQMQKKLEVIFLLKHMLETI